MGLTAPGVGIHGTPDAASIGYSASHGCIRMLISDATWLFDHVSIGTPVLIVDSIALIVSIALALFVLPRAGASSRSSSA